MMCVVSMVGDYYSKKWAPWEPYIPTTVTPSITITSGISQEEFDALKKEVADLKELLKAAKKYDEANGQKDCQNDAKMAKLKEIAKLVGELLDV